MVVLQEYTFNRGNVFSNKEVTSFKEATYLTNELKSIWIFKFFRIWIRVQAREDKIIAKNFNFGRNVNKRV